MGFLLMGGSARNERAKGGKFWKTVFHSAIPIHFTLTNELWCSLIECVGCV